MVFCLQQFIAGRSVIPITCKQVAPMPSLLGFIQVFFESWLINSQKLESWLPSPETPKKSTDFPRWSPKPVNGFGSWIPIKFNYKKYQPPKGLGVANPKEPATAGRIPPSCWWHTADGQEEHLSIETLWTTKRNTLGHWECTLSTAERFSLRVHTLNGWEGFSRLLRVHTLNGWEGFSWLLRVHTLNGWEGFSWLLRVHTLNGQERTLWPLRVYILDGWEGLLAVKGVPSAAVAGSFGLATPNPFGG
jgi:hypothetical protein